MLLARADLKQVDELLSQDGQLALKLDSGHELSPVERALWPTFVAKAPHLVLHAGFDEYAVLDRTDTATGRLHGIDVDSLVFSRESIFRRLASGAWYLFDGRMWPGSRFAQQSLHFLGPSYDDNYAIATRTWYERLESLARQPDSITRLLWLPGGPTVERQNERSAALRGMARPILRSLREEAVDLRSIHWRDLEELVAEVLASRGFTVDVTKRSRDGGRDIVALGEFGLGESMRIAVEVKQQAVVGIEDVRSALQANQDFPALMIATAGRFSLGVVEEKQRTRNMLRLFLKNGVALRQWIDAYRAGRPR